MKVEEFPSALFAIYILLQEHIAVAEARKIGIPVMAVVDTNSDPTVVDYPIMCNDDSVKEIRMVISLLIVGIQEGIFSYTWTEKIFKEKVDIFERFGQDRARGLCVRGHS